MTNFSLSIGEAALALGRLEPGAAARLYGCQIERSRHNHYRIDRSIWLPVSLAANALYHILHPEARPPMPRQPATPIEPIYPPELYAISTSGPHAYLLALGADFPNEQYIKQAEFRRWSTKLRDVIILLHVYTSNRFDHLFQTYGIDPALAPKSSIIGAAAIVDCHWHEPANQYAHVYSTPVLFDKPIKGIPGRHKYWRPQPNEPHLIKAFNAAWTDLTQTTDEPPLES